MPNPPATLTLVSTEGPVDPDAVMAATAECGSGVNLMLREALVLQLQSRDRIRDALRLLETGSTP